MPKRLVKERKREDQDVSLQPWFLPQDISLQIRMLLPHIHLTKMRYYFDDHGCLRCERRNVLYASCGLCESCSVTVRRRLEACLKKRLKAVGVTGTRRAAYDLADPVMAARGIIGSDALK
jgi:hypothetical protein